ncbi:MAG: hypothetical protein JWQ09_5842 [Segetibacter sp.]|nr:hypothetical protein [Segetibacter sp.]
MRLKMADKPIHKQGTLKQTGAKIAKPFMVGDVIEIDTLNELTQQKGRGTFRITNIKKVSSKQAKLNRLYAIAAAIFKGDHSYCMAKLEGCTLYTSDIHHKKGRGEYLMDTSTWLPVCRVCHDYIERHAIIAKGIGLSENRLDK